MTLQHSPDCLEDDLGCGLPRVAIDAGGDAGKGDSPDSILDGHLKTSPVTRFEESRSLANRSDSVDDVPRRESIPTGDLGVSGLAAVQGDAFLVKVASGGAVDGPVHSAATPKTGVGRVHDGVNLEGKLSSYELKVKDVTTHELK